MVTVLELVVAVECAYKTDDGSKDIEEVTHRVYIPLEGTHGLGDGRGTGIGQCVACATDEQQGQCGQSLRLARNEVLVSLCCRKDSISNFLH